MSQNIQQLYVANPAASMQALDLCYLGRSPYSVTDDYAITWDNMQLSITKTGTINTGIWQGTLVAKTYGGTGVSSVTTTPTASEFAGWDANANLSAKNFINGYSTTATAGATTTLVVGSNHYQYFTGATTQTVVLPVTSTLALGQSWTIVNNSSGIVTVQSSGANTIQEMAPNSFLLVTCISLSGTGTSSWDWFYTTSSSFLSWSTISGTTQAAAINSGYVIGNAAQTTVTLPSAFSVGDVVNVKGLGAGGWVLAANAGDSIVFAGGSTSAGGSLTSAHQYDSIQVVGIVANTTWAVDFVNSSGLTVA